MNAQKNVHGVKELTQTDYTQYIHPKLHYSRSPAVYVIAQQYSSPTFISSCFLSQKATLGMHFKDVIICFNCVSLKLHKLGIILYNI